MAWTGKDSAREHESGHLARRRREQAMGARLPRATGTGYEILRGGVDGGGGGGGGAKVEQLSPANKIIWGNRPLDRARGVQGGRYR